MKNLLMRENARVLEQVAGARVLLGFDFDGTLAPIVADRDRAQMRESTAVLFARLCRVYPCAVISGRSQPDVSARLGGATVRYVVGNHGLEPGTGLGDFEHQIAKGRGSLEQSLAGWAGVEIEDKRYSLAIHYRKSRQKQQVRRAIQRAVAALPIPMRLVGGKLVINVLPASAPNKADALLRLRASQRADIALYIGDDVTDEDVFKLDQPGRLLTVRVGESGSSSAAYFLTTQRDVDRLLSRLVTLRAERSSP